MDYGFVLPSTGSLAGPECVTEIARVAEGAGFSSLWVSDHVVMPSHVQSPYPYSEDGRLAWRIDDGWLEPLITLALVAGVTKNVRLGTSVLVLPQREPLLVAKQAATVDVLSNGRLVLGIGAGWMAEEFALLGQPFHDRGQRMDEMMTVLRESWTGGEVSHHGNFYQYRAYRQTPAAVQGKNIPMLIGGHSQYAYRRAVTLGDGWIPTNLTPDEVAPGIAVITDVASEVGRDLEGFEVVVRPGMRHHPLSSGSAEAYEAAGATTLLLEVGHREASGVEALVREMRAVVDELPMLATVPGHEDD